MLKVIILVRIVVCQVLTPYFMIRTRLVYQLRSYLAKHEIQPMEILVPVEVRHLILIHVEGINRHGTGLVITRCGKELILLTYGERTTLDSHHARRMHVSYTFIGLEIRRLLVKIVPTGSVTYTGIQLALLARNSGHRYQCN